MTSPHFSPPIYCGHRGNHPGGAFSLPSARRSDNYALTTFRLEHPISSAPRHPRYEGWRETRARRQKGLTLIELMVAMAIGLIVSGAVAALFIQSKHSFTQNDEIAFLQDNGRYALNVIARDLEKADFWGGISDPESEITSPTSPSDLILTSTECGTGGNWTYTTGTSISYLKEPTASTVAATFPCVSSFQPNSDIIMVKRVKGLTINDDTERNACCEHDVFLQSNGIDGDFMFGEDSLTAGYSAWQFLLHLYYIEDNTLKRKYLKAGEPPTMETTVLAEGIERFHVVFGIDSNDNSAADFYTSSPSNAQLEQAISARIYVLARSSKQITGYTNAKTYSFGDASIAAANDGYYRRVFSTSILIRNAVTNQRISGV